MTEYLRPDVSHVPDFVDDRGPAEYFHGRKRILGNFNKLIQQSIKTQGGSIFLIQGAPGSGKTALLHECEKMVKVQDWEVAKITAPSLWDPHKLLDALGRGERYKGTERSTQIGFRNLIHRTWKSTRPPSSVENVLKVVKKPLLLVLDEAQTLGIKDGIPSNQRGTVTSILNSIHNSELNEPVILLTAGLGSTKATFGELGISRFKGGCFIELGVLGKKAEHAVIHDWLTKNGGAKEDSTPWIDAITQKTHGWPQHITIYGEAAAKQIKKNQGHMTPAGLEAVYRVGMERREAYYKQRAITISRKERCSLARLIKNVSPGSELGREDIVIALSQEYDSDEAKSLFNKAVERGILHSQDGIYTIPIPSLRNWLVSEYAPEKNISPAR